MDNIAEISTSMLIASTPAIIPLIPALVSGSPAVDVAGLELLDFGVLGESSVQGRGGGYPDFPLPWEDDSGVWEGLASGEVVSVALSGLDEQLAMATCGSSPAKSTRNSSPAKSLVRELLLLLRFWLSPSLL